MRKKDILAFPSVAYASTLGGFEVKLIEYGIEDYILGVSGAWTGHPVPHRVRVRYTVSGRAYIIIHGYRIYCEDMVRMEV